MGKEEEEDGDVTTVHSSPRFAPATSRNLFFSAAATTGQKDTNAAEEAEVWGEGYMAYSCGLSGRRAFHFLQGGHSSESAYDVRPLDTTVLFLVCRQETEREKASVRACSGVGSGRATVTGPDPWEI